MSVLVNLATWFILFVVYSFIGWIFEECYAILVTHKPTNRGFLVGPICPIYGVGAVLILLVLGNMENVVAIFCVSMVGAATLEYFTSWTMEKLFHARWWDYNNMPFNLNGRICLTAAIAFGLLGVLLVRFVNPFILGLLGHLGNGVIIALAAILIGVLICDIMLSLWMIVNFRVTVGTVERDATDEISARVRQIMMEKGRLNRRLVKAFPKFEAKHPAPRRQKSKGTKKADKQSK